ncbi:DUF4358 domain-containing protein [Paenibacillus pasadenensis]|uniref:DUF4358 domain-containing protein n=1 Tax=Paenibacillus pasadenensis TaxID=217090 RepID=UPI00203D2C31|nr:DUF4358 domain-containing protein [Paenibacillus pasadenensis]MCM3747064.1 DUF4358 domain-containing protein [Paenibacillus pasadenensis]
MIKRGSLMFAMALVIALLSACSDDGGTGKVPTVAGLKDRMEQAADLSGMKQQDADKLQKLYGITADEIEDFVLYTSTSNVKADELAIIKVKDASKTASVMERIQQRIKAQTVKFKDYRPKEYYLIEKHVLLSKGPLVFFAVSENAGRMDEAFNAAWK